MAPPVGFQSSAPPAPVCRVGAWRPARHADRLVDVHGSPYRIVSRLPLEPAPMVMLAPKPVTVPCLTLMSCLCYTVQYQG